MEALELAIELENKLDSLVYQYLVNGDVMKKHVGESFVEVTDIEDYKNIAKTFVKFGEQASETLSNLVAVLNEEQDDLQRTRIEAWECEEKVFGLEQELEDMGLDLQACEVKADELEEDNERLHEELHEALLER